MEDKNLEPQLDIVGALINPNITQETLSIGLDVYGFTICSDLLLHKHDNSQLLKLANLDIYRRWLINKPIMQYEAKDLSTLILKGHTPRRVLT